METEISNAIKASLKQLVEEIAPKVRFVAKYGGEVMCPEPTSDSKFVGGIFSYKDHVSLEFSEGVSLQDPGKHLEGSGKKRRHLKLRNVGEIVEKDARGFLGQTFSL